MEEIKIGSEKIYLNKSMGEWKVIYPHKIDGKINWFNFFIGGWGNLISTLFIIFLTFSFFFIYWHDTQEMQKVVKDPCNYCSTENLYRILSERAVNDRRTDNLNVSNIKFVGGEK